ncbi:MAG TPA: hypothetical protein PKM50_00015 [Methanoregula sp.]|nr:hypothetical protein [Methanoregula sp.]
MALDQLQVNNFTGASGDDPAVKLKNLEQEVNLIKTSIKRLLIDLRERISSFENPQSLYACGGPVPSSTAKEDEEDVKAAALDAREAALETRELQMEAKKTALEADQNKEMSGIKSDLFNQPAHNDGKNMDDQAFSAFGIPGNMPFKFPQQIPQTVPEPLTLHEVFQLYSWTRKAVQKFGQDRLVILLESYRIMEYLTVKSQDVITGMARLMPEDLGAVHEVSAEEYISELYSLKRILEPEDTSLDRDMIEVLMEQRRPVDRTVNVPDEDGNFTEPFPSPYTKATSMNTGFDFDHMDNRY